MLSARSTLWLITLIGFAVNYTIRINANIAIVSMVKMKTLDNNSTAICPNYGLDATKNTTNLEDINRDKFDWTRKQQQQILGGFYWLHWVMQIPGGLLSRRLGSKAVFGLSNVICAALALIMPPAAYFSHSLLVFLRVLQGFISGVAWPSAHHMTAVWIPPNERSKFVSSFLGSSIGVALTYPFCGWIMNNFGWEWVFYSTGVIGVIWFIAWWLLVYDSPSQHPRIDPAERKYIEQALSSSVKKGKLPVPWKSIMTSVPVWVIILVQWGSTWGLFTMLTQAPMYFQEMYQWSFFKTGMLSGIPHFFRAVFAITYGVFSDFLLKKGIARTVVRKLATSICTIGMGLLLLLVTIIPSCNPNYTVTILFTAVAIHGSVSSGPLVNVVDISPNFAGVIQGIVGVAAACTGFLSAETVTYFTANNQTVEAWNKVFLITSAWLFGSGILYNCLGQSGVQSWNNPHVNEKQDNNESNDRLLKPMGNSYLKESKGEY